MGHLFFSVFDTLIYYYWSIYYVETGYDLEIRDR